MTHPLNLSLRVSALLLSLGLATTACTNDGNNPGVEYAPEMYESIPYDPLSQTHFNMLTHLVSTSGLPLMVLCHGVR